MRKSCKPLKIVLKKPTRKQHIYFLPTLNANAEKIKELFFPNAQIVSIRKTVKKLEKNYRY
jgi:hypothetical protein